jgi:hypothetical protein
MSNECQKTFQNMGWVMDRGIFIQLVKTLTIYHLCFGLLEVIVVHVHCALPSVGYQWRLGAHWEEVVWKHHKTLRYGPLDFACLIWSWSQVCQPASVQSLMGGKCSVNYGVHKLGNSLGLMIYKNVVNVFSLWVKITFPHIFCNRPMLGGSLILLRTKGLR